MMNNDLRNKILRLTDGDWDDAVGGILSLDYISLSMLQDLVENQLIDLDQTQNDSPSVGDFLDFMESTPHAYAVGYVVSPDREDTRVSIDGIKIDGDHLTPDVINCAVQFCVAGRPDEIEVYPEFRAWWD